jgi:cyclopropane fatty-acyl-phospholipid synthase-like methyltransferase
MSAGDTRQPVDYDALAAEYERRYADYDYGEIERAVLAFTHGAERVLEVGCGTGHYLRVLADHGHAPIGLDLSRQMLARARAQAPGPLAHGRAEALPFASGTFDRVCAIHAFHHFGDHRWAG